MRKSFIYAMIVIFIGLFGGIAYVMSNDKSESVSIATKQVTDSTGTEIAIPVHPKRIVFLNVSNMDMYVAAGGASAVVGKPTSQSISPDLAKKTSHAENIGIIHSPNMEKILALQPDLVIGVNVPFHNQIRETLQQNNIPLYINTLDSFDDTMKTMKFYGELAGTPDVADKKIDEIRGQFDAALALTKGKQGPKTLILFSNPASNSMATETTFSGDLLKQLGGINIADLDNAAKGQYVPLSMEYVIKEDPQDILIISMGTTPENLARFKEHMKENDAWNQVTAVKTGHVYDLPMDLFTVNPGSRTGEAITYMAKLLYPEASK